MIRERVARATATEHGAALAAVLEPSADPEEVARRQALTAEAIALLDESLEPPLDGIRDVREQAAHAALGGALSPQALRHVADTATGALRARAALDEAPAPLLRELAAAIDPALAALAKPIDRAVEEDGSDLRDNATPKLRKLRGELRTGRQRVRDKLEQLVRSSDLREHLQEDFITLRGGRPVLAVKASARRSVPGIVHDASDSGQTLFVEPFDVVELSNRQSEATSAEREEVERILRELSAAVGEARRAAGRGRRGDGANRPDDRARDGVARLEGRACRGLRRGAARRRAPSSARSQVGGTDRPRPRRPARARASAARTRAARRSR